MFFSSLNYTSKWNMKWQSHDLLSSPESNFFPSDELNTDVSFCEHTVSSDSEDKTHAAGDIETDRAVSYKGNVSSFSI